MEIIYSLENEKNKIKNSIFLAGPTYRIQPDIEIPISWRAQAINILNEVGFNGTVFNPEWKNNEKPIDWTYSRQVDWESKNLSRATVILFWIPRNNELPGFTTNIEFGEWMHSNKIVIGAPEDAKKNKYLKERCSRLNIFWQDKLENVVNAALNKIKELNSEKVQGWFISDTHFGNERTLELSKRPFNSVSEMDWTLVKNWNTKISNNDIVYHLGDFGNPEMIKYLNGKIIYFLRGNYDNDDITNQLQKDARVIIIENNQKILIENGVEIKLIHEPENADDENDFYLYGHIHNLQMVKENGLNVGVDCHNYTPIDIETVLFYRNAILNHYDQNVFLKKMGRK